MADTLSKSKVTLNEWTHIALVRDNGSKDIKIYVNGKLETINSYTIEPSTSNSEKLIIGSGKYYSDTVEDFQGSIDEVKIYNLILSDDEIYDIYSRERNGRYYTQECKKHTAPEAINDSSDIPINGRASIDILENDRVFDEGCDFNTSSIELYSDIDGAVSSDDNRSLRVPNEGVWSVESGLIKFVSESSFYDNPTPIYYSFSRYLYGY